ncbi:rhodanese-like domain-containing protein [Methylopila sp. M107]|uniref:rhodanese-like domain-containing protein n=1 Tax=Methylopila sp. M107 TaxID=1101190 RepID=UPI000363FC81|nr:rhodanese-like domain-containing protein [Methylopila sp. M107]
MRAGPAAAALIAAFMGLPALAEDQLAPPEPEGYWTGDLHGPTPETLEGAAVIDLAGLDRLGPQKPLLIDVGPAVRRPPNLPAGTIWSPRHHTIPGAVWMPGAGVGDLAPDDERRLLEQVATLTDQRKSAPIVAFCQPKCWGSWNIAKRLVTAGYTAVSWFPAGVDAWRENRGDALASPLDGWKTE